jgi:predicted ATPase
LLDKLPSGSNRDWQELGLQAALGGALLAARGFGAPETGRAYNRARVLCRQLSRSPALFPVLFGQHTYYFSRAELITSLEIANEIMSLAQTEGDTTYLLIGHFVTGFVLFCLGQLDTAYEHWKTALNIYDPIRHRHLLFQYPYDFRTVMLSYLSWFLLALGYPTRAALSLKEASAAACALSHPFTTALNMTASGGHFYMCGDWRAMRVQAEKLIALSKEQDFI